MKELKKYTMLFFVCNDTGGGIGFYSHYLAENFDRAVEQGKAYLHIFDEKIKYFISSINEGWIIDVEDYEE